MDAMLERDEIPLSRRDAARQLNVSLRTLDTLTSEGALPYIRIRGRVLFAPEDLRKFLAKCRVGLQNSAD